VDRKVVTGPRAHGEGGSDQPAAAMERPQADGARQPGKIVADDRRRRVPERFDQVGRRLRHARHGRGDAHKDSFSLRQRRARHTGPDSPPHDGFDCRKTISIPLEQV
jgi:hypothetical protein